MSELKSDRTHFVSVVVVVVVVAGYQGNACLLASK